MAIGRARLAQLHRAARIFTAPQQLASPIKGWNARDPFETMDSSDAPAP